ncbi:MAG: DUF2117 domain-containing protein [Halobacteriota archaeon]
MPLERAIDIGLVIHGPELIDSGKITDIVEALYSLGPVSALVGGTMARVAALDRHLPFIDTSQKIHTSEALAKLSDKEVLVLANCGKTSETGTVFGQIVSSRVQRSVIQVERPGLVDGRVILWRGVDGAKSSNVNYVARHLSHRLSLTLFEKEKNALSVEDAGDVVLRHVHGAKRGEPVLVQGKVVGTVEGEDVSIITRRGSIVEISGVATKAHGIEKIGNIDLRTAYIKTGLLRPSNDACDRPAVLPPRPLKRGAVSFVNHCAESTFESVNEKTICVITVGDDTTAICGDILSRAGIPIIGITDGDSDEIYAGACKAEGSIILRLDNTSDDDVGFLLERSSVLDRNDYTLDDVVDIVTDLLRQSGVDFVLTNKLNEQPMAFSRNTAE